MRGGRYPALTKHLLPVRGWLGCEHPRDPRAQPVVPVCGEGVSEDRAIDAVGPVRTGEVRIGGRHACALRLLPEPEQLQRPYRMHRAGHAGHLEGSAVRTEVAAVEGIQYPCRSS